MNNDWESLDDDVVSAWPELNSLSEWRVARISHLPNSDSDSTTPRLHDSTTRENVIWQRFDMWVGVS
jgi:hypothetical protein